MDISELKTIATRTRHAREASVALLLGALTLGLFLFVPLAPETAATAPVAITQASSTQPSSFTHIPLTAKSAIVYDLATKQVLFEKHADAQLPLASLTKLLTVYAALSTFSPSTTITIPASVMGLSMPHAFVPGESFALADLARITLTASLNDGAAAIALATADQEKRSTEAMLASAADGLHLAQTYAVNGNGLDATSAVSGGYGSAHDIAILAGALVAKAPSIVSATTHQTAQAFSKSGQSFTVKNTDPMVENIPGLLLSKTGFTDLAGGNLALVFDVGLGHPIAVVVLGSTQKARFTDGQALVAATLAHFAGVSSL